MGSGVQREVSLVNTWVSKGKQKEWEPSSHSQQVGDVNMQEGKVQSMYKG